MKTHKMNNSLIWFFILLSVVIFTIYLLVSGSELMTVALDNSDTIPLGSFITWAGIIAMPLMIYCGVKELRQPNNELNKTLSKLLKLIIIISILWLPISYLLAGNIAFNFSTIHSFQGGPIAMKLFWIFSYGLTISSITILVLYWMARLFCSKKSYSHII